MRSAELTAGSVLGPASVVEHDGVSVVRVANRLTLTAPRALAGLATGRFSRPVGGLAWSRHHWPDDIEFAGFAFTQFALPVTAGRDLGFDFRPAPGLASPRVVSPLFARSGEHVVLLAPVDSFHDQVIAVTADTLRWGWHGDLDAVPAGFASTLGIYEGDTVTEVLAAWRRDLDPTERPARLADDPVSTHLSYWTDNGAAYWYRTEAGRAIADSVAEKVEELRSIDVPVRSVELDSWFYEHATVRPITEVGYPAEVPPTGMNTWTPRTDAFPATFAGGDGIDGFVDRLGRPPLVLHSRHIAPTSSYVEGSSQWWVDRHAAHPVDAGFFRRWFDDAARWGATVIEQDWMLVYWFGVRALRAEPGRARSWQRALNEHARDTDLGLLWCMATPADLMEAALLDRVVAARTCDDYRFAADPAFLWTWFLTVNRLADVLGVPVFKDCFFSNPEMSDDADAIDGDVHAELEAALAALSNGPVGIGDRLGRTDATIVRRTCDDDGRLRRLDGPIAATDGCLFGGPSRGDGLMWATTTATTCHGVWTYVLAVHTASTTAELTDRFDLAGDALVYDWRTGDTGRGATIETTLGGRDWALFIVSPPSAPPACEVGDPARYVVVETQT